MSNYGIDVDFILITGCFGSFGRWT